MKNQKLKKIWKLKNFKTKNCLKISEKIIKNEKEQKIKKLKIVQKKKKLEL